MKIFHILYFLGIFPIFCMFWRRIRLRKREKSSAKTARPSSKNPLPHPIQAHVSHSEAQAKSAGYSTNKSIESYPRGCQSLLPSEHRNIPQKTSRRRHTPWRRDCFIPLPVSTIPQSPSATAPFAKGSPLLRRELRKAKVFRLTGTAGSSIIQKSTRGFCRRCPA